MQIECKECGALFPGGGAEFCRCERDFESWRLLSEDEAGNSIPVIPEENGSGRVTEELADIFPFDDLPDHTCIGLEAIRIPGDKRRMEVIDRILEEEGFLD